MIQVTTMMTIIMIIETQASDLSSDTDGINRKANDRCDKTKSMKFMYTNADNLMNKRSELLAIIEASKPDIIAITETLPKKRSERIQAAELGIPDFDHVDSFKNWANGRVVCIYTKKYSKAIQAEDKQLEFWRVHVVWDQTRWQRQITYWMCVQKS